MVEIIEVHSIKGQGKEGDTQNEKGSSSKWISGKEIILSIVWCLESSNHHHDPAMCINLSLSPLTFP